MSNLDKFAEMVVKVGSNALEFTLALAMIASGTPPINLAGFALAHHAVEKILGDIVEKSATVGTPEIALRK